MAELHRAGVTTFEIKSGYGGTVADEARTLRVARRFTDETTFLGAHVVPPEYAGRADDYVALVCRRRCCRRRAPRPVDRRLLRGRRVRRRSVPRRARPLGAPPGSGCGSTPTSSGSVPASQLAVELGCASADHCTYLSDDDVEALAGSDTVATFLPATDFSTRQPYPDARRAIDAGVDVALATNCNPGSSYTTSMSFVIALAVRDLRMTAAEAVAAATLGGASALRRTDIGWLGPGARADLVVLDAPSYTHLVYRPGVPLVARTIVGGQTASA